MSELIFFESEKKMPFMTLPVRSVLVRTSDRGILISPGSKIKIEEYQKLTNVTDLVAPSLFHTGGIPKACSIFKNAKVWGPSGANEAKPLIPWTNTLNIDNWPYQAELQLIPLLGMPKINEVLFVHVPSKSLILADLAFNMSGQNGFGPWLILNLFGTYNKFAVSRFFLKFVEDKSAFESSLAELFKLNFDQIIVSHGKIIRSEGKALLKGALQERGFSW